MPEPFIDAAVVRDLFPMLLEGTVRMVDYLDYPDDLPERSEEEQRLFEDKWATRLAAWMDACLLQMPTQPAGFRPIVDWLHAEWYAASIDPDDYMSICEDAMNDATEDESYTAADAGWEATTRLLHTIYTDVVLA